MKNIYEVLKAKESLYATMISEYRRLGEDVSKLGREIEAVKTTVKLLADSSDQTADEHNDSLSQPKMIEAVLAENRSEMHLSAILAAVERKFRKKLKPNVTAAVIFRYAKRRSIFYKSEAKPNTWGLLAFRADVKKQDTIFTSVERVV